MTYPVVYIICSTTLVIIIEINPRFFWFINKLFKDFVCSIHVFSNTYKKIFFFINFRI